MLGGQCWLVAEFVYLHVILGLLLLIGCQFCWILTTFYVAVGELYPLLIIDLLFWYRPIDADDFGAILVTYLWVMAAFCFVRGVNFLYFFYFYIFWGLDSILFKERQLETVSLRSLHIFLSLVWASA